MSYQSSSRIYTAYFIEYVNRLVIPLYSQFINEYIDTLVRFSYILVIRYTYALREREKWQTTPYEVNFPESCVLYLRHASSTPDVLELKVNLPDGKSFMYGAKVVKAQAYTKDDIFDKGLLILLPYYLMRYEKALPETASDDVKTAQLVAECAELRARLETVAVSENDTLLYEQVTELIIRVNDYLMRAHEDLRKKVGLTMGGEVLELLTDRVERAEREAQEAREKGIRQGLEQGRELGLEQGRELGLQQGMDALAKKLADSGVDETIIEKAIADLREEKSPETSVS